MSAHERLRELSRFPLVVSPMAGGPSTPELVVAAAEAGAVGFLAAGYKSAAEMRCRDRRRPRATPAAFGVNVFVPGEPTLHLEALADYVRSLEKEAAALGATLGTPRWDDDDYGAKLDVLLADPPALVSFTFGCPATDVVRALQAAGCAGRRDGDHSRRKRCWRNESGSTASACRASKRARTAAASSTTTARGRITRSRHFCAEVHGSCDLPLIAAGGIADPASRGGGPGGRGDAGAAGDRVPAVHRERRPSRLQGGTRRSPLHLHGASPAPSAAAGPAASSTGSCGRTTMRPPPTPRSTTSPDRCARPPRPPAIPTT